MNRDKSPTLLAIDTSTIACSAAITSARGVFSRQIIAPKKHTELILPMIDDILQESNTTLAEVDAIACVIGPGSFTGIRLGLSVAKGLALAHQLPLIGINTLRCLAHQVVENSTGLRIGVLLDARMNQVYWGCYEVNQGVLSGSTELSHVSKVDFPTDKLLWLVGDKLHVDAIQNRYGHFIKGATVDIYPDAKNAISLAAQDYLISENRIPAALLTPFYLRPAVVSQPS